MVDNLLFKIGDIVQLNSGGPEMTVHTVPVIGQNYYKCQWFAGKKLESGNFPPGSFRAVPQAEK